MPGLSGFSPLGRTTVTGVKPSPCCALTVAPAPITSRGHPRAHSAPRESLCPLLSVIRGFPEGGRRGALPAVRYLDLVPLGASRSDLGAPAWGVRFRRGQLSPRMQCAHQPLNSPHSPLMRHPRQGSELVFSMNTESHRNTIYMGNINSHISLRAFSLL